MNSVRLVRFDMGAGGSLAFSFSRGMILRATDCEFLGGFGKSPGFGNLMRGDSALVRFSRCTFRLLSIRLDRKGSSVRVFEHCAFNEFMDDPTLTPHAQFVMCNVGPLIEMNEAFGRDPISLSELFPGWEERTRRRR